MVSLFSDMAFIEVTSEEAMFEEILEGRMEPVMKRCDEKNYLGSVKEPEAR